MTQQYLVGELSLLLAQLETVAPDPAWRAAVSSLRHAAEQQAPADLGPLVCRALDVTDFLCSCSLDRGDAAGFAQQAEVASQLSGFGVCAGLLQDSRSG